MYDPVFWFNLKYYLVHFLPAGNVDRLAGHGTGLVGRKKNNCAAHIRIAATWITAILIFVFIGHSSKITLFTMDNIFVDVKYDGVDQLKSTFLAKVIIQENPDLKS